MSLEVGQKEVRVLVGLLPFFTGVDGDGVSGGETGGSVSILLSFWRDDLRRELGSVSMDFLVLLEEVDMLLLIVD